MKIFIWALRLIAAAILLQTLYFKFTGAEESVHNFRTLGMEPWGRYGSGVAELVAAILLLIPRYTIYGALMGMGVMSGAIFSHLLTPLGIDIMGDGGLLFGLAVVVFLCCAVLAWIFRREIPLLGKR